MSQVYSKIENSFTLEVLFNANQKPTSGYEDILSNQQSGGFGFEYNSAGKVEFIICLYGQYLNVSVDVTAGEWVHLVGTYDGQTIKLYKNGTLVQTKNASGTLTKPSSGSHLLAIGGDSASNGGVNNFFNGKIAIANLYSNPLTQSQISTLYQSIR